jgi:hypothetical protein
VGHRPSTKSIRSPDRVSTGTISRPSTACRARKADHREDAIVDDEAFVAAIVGSGPLEAVARYDIEIV